MELGYIKNPIHIQEQGYPYSSVATWHYHVTFYVEFYDICDTKGFVPSRFSAPAPAFKNPTLDLQERCGPAPIHQMDGLGLECFSPASPF